MPYIKEKDREKFYPIFTNPGTEGELNYAITALIHKYIIKLGVSYSVLNSVIGVLECAKLELYRQVVVPYEDIKKSENGCVSKLEES